MSDEQEILKTTEGLGGEISISELSQEIRTDGGSVVLATAEISGEIQLPQPVGHTKEDLGVEITEGATVRPLRSHPPTNPEDGITNLEEWRKRQELIRKNRPNKAA